MSITTNQVKTVVGYVEFSRSWGLSWITSILDFFLEDNTPTDAASRYLASLSPLERAMVTEVDTSSGLHVLEFHGGSMVGTVIILIVIVGILYFLRSCLVNICKTGIGFAKRPCPQLPLYGQAYPPTSFGAPTAAPSQLIPMARYPCSPGPPEQLPPRPGPLSPGPRPQHRPDEIPVHPL